MTENMLKMQIAYNDTVRIRVNATHFHGKLFYLTGKSHSLRTMPLKSMATTIRKNFIQLLHVRQSKIS